MKTRKLLGNLTPLAISAIFAVTLNSCQEDVVVNVPGPDIEYEFNYTDIAKYNPDLTGSTNDTQGYKLVAMSDTIHGKNIEEYLDGEGQKYTSVIDAATMYNAKLTLSDGHDFTGVTSFQIRYQIAENSEEIVLATAKVNSDSENVLQIDSITIEKSDIYKLISNNMVAKLYAIYDTTNPKFNCFQPGVSYKFTAKTSLGVKQGSLLNNVN